MDNVTTIGLDIAKSVFQVHGVDAVGAVVIRRKLTRGRLLWFFEKLPRCLVGIEACSSSHYWARELMARGHDVRLLPAQYVKPYLKRQKNDAADAEAICEAVTRPTMRFVPVKTPEQQSVMMLHRVRLMLNRQRTQISNALRAHLSEFGVVAPIGRNGIEQLLVVINDETDTRIPADARLCLRMLEAQLKVVKAQILENDRRVRASARETELGRRVDGDPWRGSAACECVRRDRRRCSCIQVGAMPLGLDRTRAQAELKRRQGEARQHLQSRKSLSAPVARGRRDGGDPLRRAEWDQAPMACATDGSANDQGCSGCACQQDRPNGLALMTNGERYREPVVA